MLQVRGARLHLLAHGLEAAARGAEIIGPWTPEPTEALVDGLRGTTTDPDGLGVHKSPAAYGAFPVDPYSHTPGFAGVQQPGLTGQVKEDVITRRWQLGVRVRRGAIAFEPVVLGRDEFLREPETWSYSTGGPERVEDLPAGSLAFTLCGVPVVTTGGRPPWGHRGGEAPAAPRATGSPRCRHPPPRCFRPRAARSRTGRRRAGDTPPDGMVDDPPMSRTVASLNGTRGGDERALEDTSTAAEDRSRSGRRSPTASGCWVTRCSPLPWASSWSSW